jgi:hypothetical protein
MHYVAVPQHELSPSKLRALLWSSSSGGGNNNAPSS